MLKNFPDTLLKFSLLLILFIPLDIGAQFQKSNYKILGINVEGNQTTDKATIIANSGLKVGDEIEQPGDQTINAIRRLWALNIFKDIQILVEKKIDDGIFLLIKIEEFPRLEKVLVEGNDELDEDDLLEKLNFVQGQTLKSHDIFRGIIKIKNLYEEEGYLNAEIQPIQFVFSRADTVDDELEVTWLNSEDESDEFETIYDFNPESRTNLATKIKDRILLIYRIEEEMK